MHGRSKIDFDFIADDLELDRQGKKPVILAV
jgi:hypothetical protein